MTEHSRLVWGASLLGFALGGLFDGILLHQMLQWHHLLSAIDSPALADLRDQVLADGAFHVVMYLVSVAGLWLLWRARRQTASSSGRVLLGYALIGFGIWHAIDAVLVHWILGLHRIRMDTDNPLAWDLLWVFAFGLVPAAVGWILRRGGPGNGRRAPLAALSLTLTAAVAGPLAALPPRDSDTIMVVFRPGISAMEAYTALTERGAGILWHDRAGGVWAVRFATPGQSRGLYRQGALIVSNTWFAAGCLGWLRVSSAPPDRAPASAR